jgi:hypothetical protein
MSKSTAWRTRLYIGAPNDTHKIDDAYLEYIHEWAQSVNLRGYTMYQTLGVWEGQREQGLVVESMGEDDITDVMVQALRLKLNQEGIFVTTEQIQSRLVEAPIRLGTEHGGDVEYAEHIAGHWSGVTILEVKRDGKIHRWRAQEIRPWTRRKQNRKSKPVGWRRVRGGQFSGSKPERLANRRTHSTEASW